MKSFPYKDVKETVSILNSESTFLSPALGYLIMNSNCVSANMREFGKALGPSGVLSKEFFYQRKNLSGQRYGPVSITKSKSQAAFWLDPTQLGTLVGLSMSTQTIQGKLSPKDVDNILQRTGIECNHVNGTWTGVSLQRYRQLINLLTSDYKQTHAVSPQNSSSSSSSSSSLPHFKKMDGYTFAIISRLLLEKVKGKQSILDYLLAVEQSAQKPIILDAYSDLRIAGSSVRREWLISRFDDHELGRAHVSAAVTRYLSCLYRHAKAEHVDGDAPLITSLTDIAMTSFPTDIETEIGFAQALEVIIASLAQERVFKPAIKLGRFAFGNGPDRPDCVEVVLREVLEALLYDSERHTLDPNRLPVSTAPSVRCFFEKLVDGSIEDSPINSKSKPQKIDSYDISTSEICDERSNENSKSKNAGQEWFDLCSKLRGCSYLTQGNLGEYELKPNLSNISHALSVIFGAEDSPWRSMKQFERFWNSHSCTARQVKAEESIRIFRAPFSDTEKIHLELCRLSLYRKDGGNVDNLSVYEMEIEMDETHSLAAVKLLPPSVQIQCWEGNLFYTMLDFWRSQLLIERMKDGVDSGYLLSLSLSMSLVQSVLLSDHMLLQSISYSKASNIYKKHARKPLREDELLHMLISTRWGQERESLILSENGALRVISASFTDTARKAEVEKTSQLYRETLQLVISQFESLSLSPSVIVWLLRECPPDIQPASLASMLHKLPVTVRHDVQLLNAILALGSSGKLVVNLIDDRMTTIELLLLEMMNGFSIFNVFTILSTRLNMTMSNIFRSSYS